MDTSATVSNNCGKVKYREMRERGGEGRETQRERHTEREGDKSDVE